MRATPLATRIYPKKKHYLGGELGGSEFSLMDLRFGFSVKNWSQGTWRKFFGARGATPFDP